MIENVDEVSDDDELEIDLDFDDQTYWGDPADLDYEVDQ